MGNGKKFGYARVSSESQNLDRQLDQFKSLGLDQVFTDKVSGKNTERPGFRNLMVILRGDDDLYVTSMDRLARSLKDLLNITQELKDRGVTIHFMKEQMVIGPNETTSPASKFMLEMLGAVAEFERELIRERQREGIDLAKAKGTVYKGRKPLSEEVLAEANRRIELGIPLARVARDLKVGQSTLFKYRALARSKVDAACAKIPNQQQEL